MFRRMSLRSLAARLPGARRFLRDEGGATAVEFALIGIPFFAILFAIIEVCLVFFAGQMLEKAAQDASRKILTGQAQAGNMTQAQFKQEVCNNLPVLLSCANVQLDVKSYPTFAAVNIQAPIDGSGNFTPNFGYQPGNGGDIVVVRVMYLWPLFVSRLGFNLSDVTGNQKLLMATATFRNEPF